MITSFPSDDRLYPFGGLKRFFYIPVEDIETEPEIYMGKLIGDYTFKDGKGLLTGYFDRDSAKLDINDNSDNKGDIIKSAFTAELSVNNVELDQLFCEMRCTRYIVFVIDMRMNVRVLGRVNAGSSFDFSFSSQSKIKTAASYQFKFSYESACVIPYTRTQITDIC